MSGDCGGCAGLGAHKRWCPTQVGPVAALLGPWSEQVEQWGDRIGGVPNSADNANMLYAISNTLEVRAHTARKAFQEEAR